MSDDGMTIEELQGNLEAAQEHLRIARSEGDHEDTIHGYMHEVIDARNALREAGRTALRPAEPQTVYLLTVGAYDDRQVVGIYATHGRAEAALLAEATSGNRAADMLQASEITPYEVQS
jgi:hypothetical protein